jgi:hypothetical protein
MVKRPRPFVNAKAARNRADALKNSWQGRLAEASADGPELELSGMHHSRIMGRPPPMQEISVGKKGIHKT